MLRFFDSSSKRIDLGEFGIYFGRDGGKKIHFYVQGGVLKAEVVSDSGIKLLLQIKGIPAELQTGLNDEKIAKLAQILPHFYFIKQGGDVLANGRLFGGWGENVHKGSEVGGTYKWVKDLGFSADEANVIACACAEKVPYDIFTDEGYLDLKDIKNQWSLWATQKDPRVEIIQKQLMLAKECRREAEQDDKGLQMITDPLICLGYGLRVLQDLFAHTPSLITPEAKLCTGLVSDNPEIEYLRLAYAKRATSYYLQIYKGEMDIGDLWRIFADARRDLDADTRGSQQLWRQHSRRGCSVM